MNGHAGLKQITKSFARDRRGNVAFMFAFALVPMIGVAGVVIDYSRATAARAQLNAAADSAALAAVAQVAMLKTVAEAKADAEKVFDANAGEYRSMLSIREVEVTNVGLSRTVKVTYGGELPTTLMSMFIPSIALASTAEATGARAPFIDFYLLLDNSPSMGVAATTGDIAKMEAATKSVRQCAFACHDLSNPNNFYKKAKQIGVQMRIDVVRKASQELMDTAKATATLPQQYRMATYTLGPSCDGKKLTEIQGITNDLATAKTSANAIDLMTIPYDGFNSDQCTDFNKALQSINEIIPSSKDGSSKTSPQRVMYFVSDGVADFASSKSGCSKKLTGTRCQEPINIQYCDAIKSKGIKIAVLYTTYLPLPSDDWYNKWIKPFQSEIPKKMEACASPGLFFEVNPSQGISEAMAALFQRIVSKAHLSH
ncbi:MAG TPA: pilus assembly protein TadG-related protein [Bosea sp. (in: a-proteobacteria)]